MGRSPQGSEISWTAWPVMLEYSFARAFGDAPPPATSGARAFATPSVSSDVVAPCSLIRQQLIFMLGRIWPLNRFSQRWRRRGAKTCSSPIARAVSAAARFDSPSESP